MEVILLPFDSTESDGKLQLWKLGAHLSITRINSELHEFMKLFQNIKKIKKKNPECLHKISAPQQKYLYWFAAMDLLTRYSEAESYKVMTLFHRLHKKIAENQVLRTANPSPELYLH